ncbi:MAG: hypothetical protein E7365_02925 [Clostridiales bacterium]|nr:hypothetical protein [Clostridiales bacterium]
MASLILNTNIDCAITFNGSFQGALYNNKEISLPLINDEIVICATAFDNNFLPINCFITSDPVRLQKGSAHLYKWNEEIYVLSFIFEKFCCSTPPIILKELPWAKGFLGLCGDYLVYENQKGTRTYFPEPVLDFQPLNDSFVLARTGTHIIPLNKNLTPFCNPLPCREYFLNGENLEIVFSPGDMDFIDVHQTFNENLNLIKTEIVPCVCNNVFDHLRLFCQAVRLDIRDLALNYLTPSLKKEMDFNSIKNFLGIFDQTDKPKYLSNLNENAVALRYKIDEHNFHYMCYEFNIVTTTGMPLIDDIQEL